MKQEIELDLRPTTHRQAKDCTCFECMRNETKEFLKEKKDVLQKSREREEGSQDKTGRLS